MYAIQIVRPDGKAEGAFWLSQIEVMEAIRIVSPENTIYIFKLCDPPYNPDYFDKMKRAKRGER